jgi:hypothetical protein
MERRFEVTDYWGEPVDTPEWRKEMTSRLEKPPDGIWPSKVLSSCTKQLRPSEHPGQQKVQPIND